MPPLNGKTAFITGATSGFGLACAQLLAKNGANVIASGRRIERLESLQAANVHTLALDVRDNASVIAAVASLPEAFAKVDILINNAGLALGFGSYETQKPEDLEQMVQTNIMGVIHCTQALLPGMIARNLGHIVNIGSVAGNYPYPGGNVYGGTKAFVKQFSLNLRADLLGKTIRVTNIEPGMAETEFSLVRFHGDDSKAGAVYDGIQPLTADDIANTILWCLTQPQHVNINRIELMPTQQAFSPFAVHRDES
jgi:3-hydroxy acid dehydrogenase/malonic semialdehyde reductase